MEAKFNSETIKLVIGLGNPGKKYENTYHNVGFLFTDHLTKNLPTYKPLKSDTYMNQSGRFVAKTLKNSGIRPRELLIVHDDSDIELGKYKLSFSRGSAGHKGIESVVRALKTKNFWRLRVGIRKANPPSLNLPAGQAGLRRARAGEFVLKKTSASDKKTLKEVFKNIEKELLICN